MNPLAQKMRQEIERDGPMTFARFMEMALYEPGLGYYEQPGRIGRGGDYFTSVSAGPLFGQLLAFQFAQWLDTACPENGCQIVESGAHDGKLAADILEWFARFRPDLLHRLEYRIIESSSTRRAWQEKALSSRSANLAWTTDIGEFTKCGINGIVFSNEFFDALPVHRLAWDAGESRWREWRVVVNEDAFAWHLGEPDDVLKGALPPVTGELEGLLPDGFMAEISPAAVTWWRAAGRALGQGRLLTIDYGFREENGLRPDHPGGSLRAFARHHASENLLDQPGEQDLTADVDFFALEAAGRAAGLEAGTLLRQSTFLTQILAKIHARPESFPTWDRKCASHFQTLTHPEHLGQQFQVLIQERSAMAKQPR
jgi:SAM-dependent MidA family methyltransferase